MTYCRPFFSPASLRGRPCGPLAAVCAPLLIQGRSRTGTRRDRGSLGSGHSRRDRVRAAGARGTRARRNAVPCVCRSACRFSDPGATGVSARRDDQGHVDRPVAWAAWEFPPMSVLRSIESKIAGLVEGTFSRVVQIRGASRRTRAQARARDGGAQVILRVAHLCSQRVPCLPVAPRSRAVRRLRGALSRRARGIPARARPP